jgi:hypothetical protein
MIGSGGLSCTGAITEVLHYDYQQFEAVHFNNGQSIAVVRGWPTRLL